MVRIRVEECKRTASGLMNDHALEVLEFRDALAIVARHAASEVGREAVLRLEPSTDHSRAAAEIRLVAEGMGLLGGESSWTMPGLPDLRDPLSRLKLEGYAWDGPSLRQAAELIAAGRAVRKAILPLAEEVPSLAVIANRIAEMAGVPEEIVRAIDDDGRVRDNASPELSRLRREIQGARNRIVRRLTEFAASLAPQYQVADGSVSVREGRYVIPIRREGRAEVGGIVHGESQTGSTLFVEPPAAIEMMNRLREMEAAEAREVLRILRELTDRLRPNADALRETFDALVRLDTVYARSRYATANDGHPPEVLPPGAVGFEIVQGRHPVLLAQGAPVVPFDLRMEERERTLVISGPNTGGKTVFLKAVGLLALLTQAGVVPPIGPRSRMPVFGSAFADIGDEQSIEASLSTFSAHLRNLRETLAAADHESLVLIDEIGSGTDPLEGAALATAILVELTERSCFTVATTHLGALKLLATEDPRVVNASLQFDPERLQPTYLLVKGVPGRSYGLAIARRLGLPSATLERAEAAMPAGERDVGRLLLELEAREKRAAELEGRLEVELARNRELTASLEAREREMARREKDAERRARQQARDLLMHSRAEVEAAISELRAATDQASVDEAARSARRRVEDAARRQRERIPRKPAVSAAPPGAAEPLTVGAQVRIASLGRTGTILELRDSRAVVDAGGIRMQLPTADLEMLPEGTRTSEARTRSRPAGGRFEANLEARPEVDLRGLRVDELALRLGRALDSAIVAGLPSFRIIHGKGTGALRAEVEDLLRGDPRVTSYRPGDRFEGGTGVTVVEFG